MDSTPDTGSDGAPGPSARWLQAVGQAAGGVAHDFDNALTAIITRASLLSAGSHGPEVDQHAQAILAAAAAASGVVDRIRTILKPREQRDFVRVDPRAVLRQAADMVVNRRASGVTVALELGAASHVAGVPADLLQVVVNLATNAIDASPPDECVFLRCRDDGDRVVIDVEDRGPGIPPDRVAACFEPFMTTKGDGGTGLGLVLCQRLVEAHGGTLALQPRPGGGTVARVGLPHAAAAISEPKIPTALDLKAAVTPATVLVVDDDASTASALEVLLRAGGFDVHLARGVASAYEALERVRPTMVLTDLRLSDGDGWSVVRRARASDAAVQIVVLTGLDVELTDAEASRRGIEAVLRKPINPGTLVRRLRRMAAERSALATRLKEVVR